jgi:hypothetical protein
MEEKCIFLGEGLVLGHDPGLLGYGLKIPDSTIDICIQKDHRPEFQLSRCNSGRKIGNRRTDIQTDDITISVL